DVGPWVPVLSEAFVEGPSPVSEAKGVDSEDSGASERESADKASSGWALVTPESVTAVLVVRDSKYPSSEDKAEVRDGCGPCELAGEGPSGPALVTPEPPGADPVADGPYVSVLSGSSALLVCSWGD